MLIGGPFLSIQMEIKNHVFFSPINWDELNSKKITPPFNPNVVRKRSSSSLNAGSPPEGLISH